MIPSETKLPPPFQISRCKGEGGRKKKRKKEEYHRGPSFVNLFIGHRGDHDGNRSCVLPRPPPFVFLAYVDGKKRKRSVDRILETKRTYLSTNSIMMYSSNCQFQFFSITIGEKKRACDYRSFDFSIKTFLLSIVSLFMRENKEDHPAKEIRLDSPYFENQVNFLSYDDHRLLEFERSTTYIRPYEFDV